MPRLLFEKTGSAVWMSHLDLMRLFQRAFKRADLPLKHTQGFNPRPSVSIALPLSVGVESSCELLDFDLEGKEVANEEIAALLNEVLIRGVRVLGVYDDGKKIKHLTYLDCNVYLEYDNGIPEQGIALIDSLFSREEVLCEKRSKNGMQEINIIPMIKKLRVLQKDSNTVVLQARICCQNPTLNPAQLCAAIERHLPELKPDFSKCERVEVYDAEETIFR